MFGGILYCKKCNEKLVENAKFCAICGQQVFSKAYQEMNRTETKAKSNPPSVNLQATYRYKHSSVISWTMVYSFN